MKKMSMFFLTNFDIEFFQEKLFFYEIYEELRYITTFLFPSLLVVQKIASQLWTSPAAIICRREVWVAVGWEKHPVFVNIFCNLIKL